MLIKNILANYIANEMLELRDEMSHNLTDHFELIFPMKTIFPSQNLPMERALSGKQLTILILLLMLFHAKKNEF
jgi:hypothetical protein